MPPVKPIAVVIDDDDAWLTNVRECLDPAFDVHPVTTGEAGLALMRTLRPALVILDAGLRAGSMQGKDVLAQMKADPALERVPVVMLTERATAKSAFRWKADEYVTKAQFPQQFNARVDQLLSRAALWPFDSASELTLSLSLRQKDPVELMVGVLELHERTQESLELNIEELVTDGRVAYGGNWQAHTRRIGRTLYKILMKHPEIVMALSAAIQGERRVNIAASIDMLEVPLEFLRDQGGQQYAVLHYPFSRSVLDVRSPRGYEPPISPKRLNDLVRTRMPLRVLLIASDLGGVPRVDFEVEAIHKLLNENSKSLRIEAKVLNTANATMEAVSRELKTGRYHIVHFAGHGQFVEHRDKGVEHRLWLKGANGPESLNAQQLQSLWSNNRPCLFYMSCCRSAATGGTRDLINSDLLGLTSAAISAGVPSVIGFRWPVLDDGAFKLATAFYEELLLSGRLDHAMLNARNRVYFNNQADPTWLSPVLVMQPPQ